MQSPSRAGQALAVPSLLWVSLQPILRHWGPRARFWSHHAFQSLLLEGEAWRGASDGVRLPGERDLSLSLQLLELHAVMETPLEKALTTMVTTFHKYSGREGSKLTLSKKELKELIKKELCLGEKMRESSIDDLMKSLDKNSDQEIDFKEYSVFLTTLCMAYNDFFLEESQ